MPSESSEFPLNSHKGASSQTRLLNEVAAGNLDNLSISVWFTHPAEDTYRTWLICADCNFHARAQHTCRSDSFSEDRVCPELEKRDWAVLKQSLFKRSRRQ
jgi:hypothetical protein